MQSSSVSINLVKPKVNLSEEIVKWALTVGRLLIIITELVAFSTFVYRFSLDRTLIDIRTKVTQQQALVESLKERENTYRNIQERISLAKSVGAQGQNYLTILNDVYEMGGSDISFTNLQVEKDSIKIIATTRTISSFTQFTNALKEYPLVEAVSIDKIDNKSGASSVGFSITAILKQ